VFGQLGPRALGVLTLRLVVVLGTVDLLVAAS
jgi:hypothetical protein